MLKEDFAKSGLRTIGEFLAAQNITDKKTRKPKGLRFSPGRFPWYPLRELYEHEFDAIQNKQKEFYPNAKWDEIKHAIFFQRPLRKQERGKCQFDLTKERTFKAMPCSIRCRILQEVRNLALYGERNEPVELTEEQRDIIIETLDKSAKDVTFDAIRKKLKINYRFNLESEIRSGLKGNHTGHTLRGEKCFGKLWDTFSLSEQDGIVEMLIEEEDENKIIAALGPYNLSGEQKIKIARFVPPQGIASLCKEITEQLVAVMEVEKCHYNEACEKLGFSHSEEIVEKHDFLPYYGKVLTGSVTGGDEVKFGEDMPEKRYGKIANPTVHIALNQTRIIVNALIKKYGKPAQVVIELSRDLKASRDSKAEMIKRHSENVKRNAIHNKNIIEAAGIAYPNRADRLKWRLWSELGENELSRRCIVF